MDYLSSLSLSLSLTSSIYPLHSYLHFSPYSSIPLCSLHAMDVSSVSRLQTLTLLSFSPVSIPIYSSPSSKFCSTRGPLLAARRSSWAATPLLPSSPCEFSTRLFIRGSMSLEALSHPLLMLLLCRIRSVSQESNVRNPASFHFVSTVLHQLVEAWIVVNRVLVNHISKKGQRTCLYRSGEICDAFEKLKGFIHFPKWDLTDKDSINAEPENPKYAGGTIRKGALTSSKYSLNAAGGKIPFPSIPGGPTGKRIALAVCCAFANDTGKQFVRRSHSSAVTLPSLRGSHSILTQNASEQSRLYNRLLKDGRLKTCIELLEAMERSGSLDMNKVYHVKFFDNCKSQKAVEEAFRFTKLILNPTLSTYNMLLSVCASSQDFEGAFQVLQLVREAGLKADCKLYTTLISTCAKTGKVDAMFEVFHEMVNTKVEPNVHTYGALIDGCARAGQIAKAFGVYGILRSKKVKPDRVVFNALITACGQAGAVDRAFDVLAEMKAEKQPIDPDEVTVGALMKACMNAGRVDRAREVYKMMHEYQIKGAPEVYTIALNSCSQSGDWEFACNIHNDMIRNGVVPDEMFLSALIDVAGHVGKVDAAFGVVQEARTKGRHIGAVAYSSLMGACSNGKSWEKALELYEDIKSMKLNMPVSAMNALITALCNSGQLEKAIEVLSQMYELNARPNNITYSILVVACEKKDDLEVALALLSQSKDNGVTPTIVMWRCLLGMSMRRFKKACRLGEPVLSFNSGRPQLDNKWTATALMVYREIIMAGIIPSGEILSNLLRCLQLPHDTCSKDRLIENLGIHSDISKYWNLRSLVDGFGEYDLRAISLLEEAASLGIVPCISMKESPIVIDARNFQVHVLQVYLLAVLKGLKHRLAAGAKLPNIMLLLPIEKTQIQSGKGVRTVKIAGRITRAIVALLRRLRLPFQGSGSYGKIRISGLLIKKWFQPKITPSYTGTPAEMGSSQNRLRLGISYQQRDIRSGNLSLE